MKTVILLIICILFSTCNNICDNNNTENEPPYAVKIAWDHGLMSNDFESHIINDDYVYFYECPPEYNQVNIYTLTKLEAETGNLIWRSIMFSNILRCQPIIIDGYVYVFLQPNIVLCFDTETGEHIATAQIDKEFELEQNIIAYQCYLYFGLWGNGRYFARFNTQDIQLNGNPDIVQDCAAELLWIPKTNGYVTGKPCIYNNTIFAGTYNPSLEEPVELVGLDMDTWQEVFYTTFGGPDDTNIGILFPEDGAGIAGNPIFIHGDILYYLSWSISAWNLKNGKRLYRHTFPDNTPQSKRYFANNILQAVYYKGNIYYASNHLYETPEDRNIHCINAATGKLVWNAIAKGSETLTTNLIVAHDKVYVSQFYGGFRVYDFKSGKLIGADHSFYGRGMSRNVLYKDYILCIRTDPDTGDGRLVAVDISE